MSKNSFLPPGGLKTFTNSAASIFSTIDAENCETQAVQTDTVSSVTTSFVFSQRTHSWRANGLPGQTSVVEPLNIDDGVSNSFYVFESDCAVSFPVITGVTAGSVPPVCTDWGSPYVSVAFTPNSFEAAPICTDGSFSWIYNIDSTPIASVKDFLKVSIDSENNQIWVKAMAGPSVSAIYTLTVTGRLLTGDEASFNLIINVTPCPTTQIIPPSFLDQVYYVMFPVGSYDAPSFSIDPACPQTLFYSNSASPNTFISDSAGTGKFLTWQTDADTNIGPYTVTITATNYCQSASQSYTLDVKSVCDG